MLYEIRRYALAPAGAAEFVAGFETELVPILVDNGFDLVGSWTVEVGAGSTLVWMLRWPDLGFREAAYARVRADERNVEFRRRNLTHLTSVENEILAPTPGSPLG